MKKIVAIIFLIFTSIYLMACGDEHPLKMGYLGFKVNNLDAMESIQKDLQEKRVDYYLYEDEDGDQVIAYLDEFKIEFKKIKEKYIGSVPLGFKGLCFESDSKRNIHSSILESKRIPFVQKNVKGWYCVYWPKDSKVSPMEE